MYEFIGPILLMVGTAVLVIGLGHGFWIFIQSACKDALEKFFAEMEEKEAKNDIKNQS